MTTLGPIIVLVLSMLGHPARTAPPQPEPVVEHLPLPQHVSGKASWYCSPQIPICHHSYPPGSMVAAACAKLRTAMGPHWRGKRVTVVSGSRSISVTLVDWCGSKDKLIDLYREPMRRLGGSGVLRVTVSWQ